MYKPKCDGPAERCPLLHGLHHGAAQLHESGNHYDAMYWLRWSPHHDSGCIPLHAHRTTHSLRMVRIGYWGASKRFNQWRDGLFCILSYRVISAVSLLFKPWLHQPKCLYWDLHRPLLPGFRELYGGALPCAFSVPNASISGMLRRDAQRAELSAPVDDAFVE